MEVVIVSIKTIENGSVLVTPAGYHKSNQHPSVLVVGGLAELPEQSPFLPVVIQLAQNGYVGLVATPIINSHRVGSTVHLSYDRVLSPAQISNGLFELNNYSDHPISVIASSSGATALFNLLDGTVESKQRTYSIGSIALVNPYLGGEYSSDATIDQQLRRLDEREDLLIALQQTSEGRIRRVLDFDGAQSLFDDDVIEIARRLERRFPVHLFVSNNDELTTINAYRSLFNVLKTKPDAGMTVYLGEGHTIPLDRK